MTSQSGGTAAGEGRARGAAREGTDDGAVLLVAGLADLAVSTLGTAMGTVRGLLRRSDTGRLVEDAEQDLRARGRLALDRYAAVPPAHLEVLAQHVLERRSRADG
ncbi:polyprenyl synthetase [Streptomyces laurentii]|uniref:polyprenyl synthetase n=1 Tax=Streptomyces laurentii TaxID=39478 RepID=UPI0036A00D8B